MPVALVAVICSAFVLDPTLFHVLKYTIDQHMITDLKRFRCKFTWCELQSWWLHFDASLFWIFIHDWNTFVAQPSNIRYFLDDFRHLPSSFQRYN